MKQEEVKLLESDAAVWKTKEGEIPFSEMENEYLMKVESIVERRIESFKSNLNLHEAIKEKIKQEKFERNLKTYSLIKNISEVEENSILVLDDELIEVKDLRQSSKFLMAAIKQKRLKVEKE